MKNNYLHICIVLLLSLWVGLVRTEEKVSGSAASDLAEMVAKKREAIAKEQEEALKQIAQEDEKKEKPKYLYKSEKPVEPKNKEERTKAAAEDVNKMFEMLREFSSPPGACPLPSSSQSKLFNNDTSIDDLGKGSLEKIARLARDEIGHAFDCSDAENGFTGCPVDNLKCAAQTSRLLIKAGVLEESEGSDAVVGVVNKLISDKKGWKECPQPFIPGAVAFTNSTSDIPENFRQSGYERSHIGVVTIVNGRTGIVNNKGSEGGELGVDYEGEWFDRVKFLCPPQ
jgi:hypothetical protein